MSGRSNPHQPLRPRWAATSVGCLACNRHAQRSANTWTASASHGRSPNDGPVPHGTSSASRHRPTPRAASFPAVSCTSSSVCTAVGYYNTRDGVQTTLVEVWNGTSWEIEHPAVPDGAVASQLAGVALHIRERVHGRRQLRQPGRRHLHPRRTARRHHLGPPAHVERTGRTGDRAHRTVLYVEPGVCRDRVQVLPLLVRTPPPASRDRRDVERTPMGYGDGRQPVRHRQQRPGRSVLCRHAVHRRRFPVRLGRA